MVLDRVLSLLIQCQMTLRKVCHPLALTLILSVILFILPHTVSDDLEESLLPPDIDPGLEVSERLEAVRGELESHRDFTLCAFDIKNQMKLLCQVIV